MRKTHKSTRCFSCFALLLWEKVGMLVRLSSSESTLARVWWWLSRLIGVRGVGVVGVKNTKTARATHARSQTHTQSGRHTHSIGSATHKGGRCCVVTPPLASRRPTAHARRCAVSISRPLHAALVPFAPSFWAKNNAAARKSCLCVLRRRTKHSALKNDNAAATPNTSTTTANSQPLSCSSSSASAISASSSSTSMRRLLPAPAAPLPSPSWPWSWL